MRYAAKTDRNQPAIVEELRARGYDVDIISREKGMYDVVVSGCARWSQRRAVAVRVEIKVEGGSLTPAEREYWSRQKWTDNLLIATCTEDVLAWFDRSAL